MGQSIMPTYRQDTISQASERLHASCERMRSAREIFQEAHARLISVRVNFGEVESREDAGATTTDTPRDPGGIF
jgi:hypothetical protein